MKLAISNIAWDKDQDGEVFNLMERYGFSGLEIAPTKLWESPLEVSDQEINKYKRKVEERGVKIIAMQSLLYGRNDLTIFNGKEVRIRTIQYLKTVIDFGNKLGVKDLVFGSPKNRLVADLNRKDYQKIAKDFFSEVGLYANKFNMTFCIEPNPPEYGADFIISTNQAFDIVEETNAPGFKVNLDTGTSILNNEDITNLLNNKLSLVAHVHVSEPFLKEINPDENMHQIIADFLMKKNYDKWVSIEMKNPESNNINKIKNALSLVSRLYSQPYAK